MTGNGDRDDGQNGKSNDEDQGEDGGGGKYKGKDQGEDGGGNHKGKDKG